MREACPRCAADVRDVSGRRCPACGYDIGTPRGEGPPRPVGGTALFDSGFAFGMGVAVAILAVAAAVVYLGWWKP